MKWDPFTADNFTTMQGVIEAADTAWVEVLKIDIEGANEHRSSTPRDDPCDSHQGRPTGQPQQRMLQVAIDGLGWRAIIGALAQSCPDDIDMADAMM